MDISAGRFRLLGHDRLECGSPVNWHRDPISGAEAPLLHWSRIPYLDVSRVGDHKVIWELNRHAAVVRLAQAHLLDQGASRHRDAAINLLHSWLHANPPKRGINWCSSLEIAFRAIAWLWSARLLNLGAVDPDLWEALVASLYVHGRHLERHLSTAFSPNTHLTGEALGLLYIGTLVPSFDRSRQWADRGAAVLWNEAARQLLPDGTYFEQSTYYQRYTIDFYVHAALLLGGTSALPSLVRERLRSAVAALAAAQRPDGTMPLLGDDDGGQLLALDERALDDFRDSIGAAAMVFGPKNLASDRLLSAQSSWLVGGGESDVPGVSEQQDKHLSRHFPDGGLVVVRSDASDRANWALLAAGAHGAVNGAHAHADALALELSVDGQRFFVDSGTYTYTGVARDEFRGAKGHSVVLLNGQGSATTGSMFRWATEADAIVERYLAGDDFALVAASIDGFHHLASDVECARTLLWLGDGAWLLEDVVRSRQPYTMTLNFVVAPGINSSIMDTDVLLVATGGGQELLVAADGSGVWTSQPAWISTGFASRELGLRLQFDRPAATAHRSVLALLTSRVGAPAPRVLERRQTATGHVIRVQTGTGETVTIARTHRGALLGAKVVCDAEWGVIWHKADGSVARALVVAGALTIAGQSLRSFQNTGAAYAEWDGSTWLVLPFTTGTG
jgi:hypothetical protein